MICWRHYTLDVAKWTPHRTYTVVIVHPHGTMNMRLAAGIVCHAFRRGCCTSSQIAAFLLRAFMVGSCDVIISTSVPSTTKLCQHRNRQSIGSACYRCTAVSYKHLNPLGKVFQVFYGVQVIFYRQPFSLYFTANNGE